MSSPRDMRKGFWIVGYSIVAVIMAIIMVVIYV